MKKQKKTMVMLLVVIMIGTLLAGCAKSDNQSQDQQPVEDFRDKELVVAVRQANNTFNPFAPHNRYDTIGRNQIFDTLVCKNNKGEIVPSLAERYEISPDAMTYTFWLKKGVKFTNGIEFKASDAKFSIEKAMQAPATKNYFSSIASVDIIDDYTIKINMKTPNVSLLEILVSFGQMVSEEALKKYGDQFGTTVESTIGTGPYILKEWEPNKLCVFEANPDYFKGEPDIKKVRFKAITDANAAIIALQTGEVGLYLDTVPSISVDSIEKNKNLNLTPITPERLFYIFMNNQSGPFTDVRLRKAVAYAIDRQKLLMVGTEGRGTPVNYPGLPKYTGNPNIKTGYPMDIEKAKQLVKEAGMEGKKITLTLENTSPLPALATSIQNDLSKIGLNVEIQLLEVNAFLKDVQVDGKYEICVSYTTAKTQDMDTVWTMLLSSSNIGISNNARYSNPKMDEILAKARGETNPEVRKQLYAEAIKIFNEDVPLLALHYEPSNRAYSKDLVIDPGLVEYNIIYYYKWNHNNK